MDLDAYGCVDLDSYGCPVEQLDILFKRDYKGIVFFTYCQFILGAVPFVLLEHVGVTGKMARKVPSVFAKIHWMVFTDYLAKNGVTEIFYIRFVTQGMYKYYGGFNLKHKRV